MAAPQPSSRRFPAPWQTVDIPGGYRIDDAHGQSVAYVYGDDLHHGVNDRRLTKDEARRIARAIARLPELLGAHPKPG